jgi:hypothetical protein
LAKNEDGEFELILGNRQLISVFLIVVILLGLFFSMGYIVGRNSAPAVAEIAHETKPAKTSSAPASESPSAEPSRAPETPAPEAEPPGRDRSAAGTHVAKDVPESTTPASAVAEKPKPSPSHPATPPAAPARASLTGDPSPGDYWQVVATARPDAEIITEALTKKGFHAVMAPAPKDGVFRVLIGPLKDPGTQAQTRTALEAAGFKNPIVRKY